MMKARLAPTISFVVLVIAVFACLMLGQVIHRFLGGLPASIYGMAIFALGLQLGLVPERTISRAAERCLKHLTLVFVPVALGIMRYGDLLVVSGWEIVLAASITTVCGMICVGLAAQKLLPHDKHS